MKNETKEIRYIDLFGGVGGFRLGIERATNLSKEPRKEQGRDKRDLPNNKQFKISGQQFSCVFYCDNDKYAVQTYNKNFGENYEAKDIRTIAADSIPDFDMLCGGFPCQAFSIAGKRRGFEDTRGTLFFEIARIIKAKRPKIVFLENVKGLLSHGQSTFKTAWHSERSEGGKTFQIIIETLSELGYDVQWMVLNSKFFGVPQNRERVFIIGSLRGTGRPEILPFRQSGSKIINELEKKPMIVGTTKSDTAKGTNSRSWVHDVEGIIGAVNSTEYKQPKQILVPQSQIVKGTDGVSSTINAHGGGQGAKTGLYAVKQIGTRLDSNSGTQPFQQDRVYDSEGISPALQRGLPEGSHKIKIQPAQLVNKNRAKKPYNPNDREMKIKVRDDDTSYTVKSATHEFMVAVMKNKDIEKAIKKGHLEREDVGKDVSFDSNKMSIRRLTPIECERLQGFPDNWTEKGSFINSVQLMSNIWKDVKLKDAKEKLLSEKSNYVLNIIKDGENGETQILPIKETESIQENANVKGAIEILTAKDGVCDIINHGKDMVIHFNQKKISNLEILTKKNLILELIENQNTSQLLKITLDEKLSKEKLSIILTWIKEIIKYQTYISVKTEKPITTAIIVFKKLEQNYSKEGLLNLRMENIILTSDTQRYKQMGNAVTVNVIQAIAEKLLKL